MDNLFVKGNAELERLAANGPPEQKKAAEQFLGEFLQLSDPTIEHSICCRCGQSVPVSWLNEFGNCC